MSSRAKDKAIKKSSSDFIRWVKHISKVSPAKRPGALASLPVGLVKSMRCCHGAADALPDVSPCTVDRGGLWC